MCVSYIRGMVLSNPCAVTQSRLDRHLWKTHALREWEIEIKSHKCVWYALLFMLPSNHNDTGRDCLIDIRRPITPIHGWDQWVWTVPLFLLNSVDSRCPYRRREHLQVHAMVHWARAVMSEKTQGPLGKQHYEVCRNTHADHAHKHKDASTTIRYVISKHVGRFISENTEIHINTDHIHEVQYVKYGKKTTTHCYRFMRGR